MMNEQRKSSLRDPAVYLNEDLMFRIFSFVGGRLSPGIFNSSSSNISIQQQLTKREDEEEEEDEEWIEQEVRDGDDERFAWQQEEEAKFLPVVEAAQYYSCLVRVSKRWKRIMDTFVQSLVGPLEVNLDQFSDTSISIRSTWNTWRVKPCLLWLCRHKLSLGSIVATRDAKQLDLPLLVHVLNECNTTITTRFWIPVRFTTEEYSAWQDPSSAYFNTENQMKDREYQDAIAKQCPNLKKLCVCLRINRGERTNQDYPEAISTSLFGVPILTELSIVLEIAKPMPTMERLFFTRLIQNLPSLRFFAITCQRSQLDHWVFHIQSSSLRQLLVPNFTQRACFSIDCPRLEFFRCTGLFEGTGQIPVEQELFVFQKVVEIINAHDNCLALVDQIQEGSESDYPVGLPLRRILDANFLDVQQEQQLPARFRL